MHKYEKSSVCCRRRRCCCCCCDAATLCARAEPTFVFLSKEENRRLCLRSPPPKRLDQSILFSLAKLLFFKGEHPFIDELIVIIEPAVESAQLLGLDSKLHRSSMTHILNRDLTRFMQSLPRVRKNRARD